MFIKNKIDIDIEPNSAVITTSALEQVGGDIDSFIDFVLEKKPKNFYIIEKDERLIKNLSEKFLQILDLSDYCFE